ncbi:MAG: group 1 truncated hemoglobin [Burkholderiaceae bacterium]
MIFFDLLAADPATNRTFEDVDLDKLKYSFATQLCELTGGGCRYEGESMKDAHAGMDITEAEFSRTVAHLRTALDEHVHSREKNEILRLMAAMKRDVVTGPFNGEWETISPPKQAPLLPKRLKPLQRL